MSTGSSAGTAPVRRPEGDPVIALAGNPNVGKSTLFNSFTGLGVSTAHYPGTTREVHMATARWDERVVGIVDLPGAYGLTGLAEEARVARRALLDLNPDVVVVVVDPSTLGRTLYLALEVLDLGLRTVIAVNLADEARRAGIEVELDVISRRLGVPVVQTIATQGVGVHDLVAAAIAASVAEPPPAPAYSPEFEAAIAPLVDACGAMPDRPAGLGARALALQLIEGRIGMEAKVTEAIRASAEAMRSSLERTFGEPAPVRLARERHGLAGLIGEEAVVRATRTEGRIPRGLWALTTWPWTGVPLVGLVAASIFGFLFVVGDLLARGFSALWETLASPVITAAIEAVAGTGVAARILGWGFNAGIEASLAIGLPYILTFYFLLGMLEDTGYLNSLAFLSDRVMHRLGLHGRAVVPLVAAAGCNVPALIAAGDLPTKRERFIASALVVFIPCSARTAVILGAVGAYVGWQATLAVLAVIFVLVVAIGLVLDRMLAGVSRGLVMEMFPFRRPSLKRVAEKAWVQFREFLFVATPIVIVGSLVLGGLYESGWLWKLSGPLSGVTEAWLGLPAVAGLTLIVGMLRKELSLQLLVALAVATAGFAGARLTDIMSTSDIVVYALVNAIALPCVSSVAVFWRRQGWVRTAAVVVASIVLALVIGGVAARLVPAVL